jgi:hypothetical protein
MSIFQRKTPQLKFANRAEAFAYMLALQIDKGCDAMQAAESANKFAEIFAENMGFPSAPPPRGMDKYLGMIDKVVCYCDEHPKAVDMVTGVATFIVGAFAGRKAEQIYIEEQPSANIDFSTLE